MSKGLKIALIPVIAIVVLLVAVLLFVMFALSGTASTAVETIMPKITGTPVKLEGFTISPFSGKGTIKGFIIGNPKGYNTPSSFELGKVRVDVDLGSLFTDTIVIEEIYIDAPKITYEAGIPSNIGQIQKNVEEYAGPPKEGEEPEEEEKEEEAGPGKKIIIRHFLLENGQIALSARFLQGHAAPVPLPKVELHDVGGGEDGEGKSIAEVSKEIFTSVGGEVTKLATEKLNEIKKLGGKVIEGGLDAGKDALEGGKDAGKKVLEGGKEAGKEAVDAVKGLFGGGDKKEE